MSSLKKVTPILIISSVVLLSLACSFLNLPGGIRPIMLPEEEEVKVREPSKEVSEESKPTEPSPEVKESETYVAPSATAIPDVKKLELGKIGFGQNDTTVGYGFMLKNPNPNLGVAYSEYQIAAYDASDIVIGTQTGYIDLLLPGQELGIGNELYLDAGEIVSRIDLKVFDGTPVVTDITAGLTARNAVYQHDPYSSKVIGEVLNPFEQDLLSFKVSALLYDAADNIIGGGNTYASFIPGNSFTGVESYVSSSGEVARVELFPMMLDEAFLNAADPLPEDVEPLVLLDQGFGVGDYFTSYAFKVQNPNTQYSLQNSFYRVLAYNADKELVDIAEGYLSAILPEAVLGVSGDFYMPEGTMIDSILIQILQGEFNNTGPLANFTTEVVVVDSSGYSPKVTGIVLNPYSVQVSNLYVYAVIFDSDEKIIGGGFNYLEFIPANARAKFEIDVSYGGTASLAEVYVLLSDLSEIQ